MNTHKQINKDVKITIENYDFLIQWNTHKQTYKILHNNGLSDANGEPLGLIQFCSEYNYPTLSKVRMDLHHIIDNKQTYILKSNKRGF